MSSIILPPQKHCGQLIHHGNNSSVAPAVKSGVHLLSPGRCAVRKVLHPLQLNRQILWQDLTTRSLPSSEADRMVWGIWCSELLPDVFSFWEGTFFRHLLGAFDEPYMSFPAAGCQGPSVHKIPKPVSQRICPTTARLVGRCGAALIGWSTSILKGLGCPLLFCG